MTLTSIITPAFLASGVYNLESSRFRGAPLDTREEGWTEKWGGAEGLPNDSSLWSLDEEAITLLLATQHPQMPPILSQFRPAYFEQLVLRIAGIPHIAVNSPYISNEATGPLPFLRDYQPSKPPALVGRRHPSNIVPSNVPCQNSILDYLMSNRNVNLDAHLKSDSKKSMSKCFLNLVSSELDCLLIYLRYEDQDAWEQVYRGRYLEACTLESKNTWMSSLKGRFQAFMERAVSRRRVMEYSKTMSVNQAVERAKEAYQALEQQLTSHNSAYLLGTDTPSLVDAVLWAHLADALCDVHLVVLLSSFPGLVKFFQHIYKTYFTGSLGAWDTWNLKQNMENAFSDISLEGGNIASSKSAYKDAIELMQSISMRNQDLQEVLDAANAKRKTESWPDTPKLTDSILYRWRMGENPGKLASANISDPHEANKANREKMMREQERSDQIWISGVAGISALVIFALQGAGAKS
jgi:hypothetical protein